MNTTLWLLAGLVLSWIAFTKLRVNQSRGLFVALIIGAASAYFGGSVLAPYFALEPVDPGDFHPFALLVACATASGLLVITDMVHERYGI